MDKFRPRALSPTAGLTGYTHSGISWLMNCMIELGLYTDHEPPSIFKYMQPVDEMRSEYEVLHASSRPVKHYLPALTFKDKFIFKNNSFFCHLSHDLAPQDLSAPMKVAVMIRDPRDAIWSQYNENSYNRTFEEAVKTITYSYAWQMFNLLWLEYPNAIFIKFEDMKKNPFLQLKKILTFFDISCTDDAIQQAVSNSSSERSREAEMILRSKVPFEELHFKNIINRSGKIEQWKQLPEHQETFNLIAEQNRALLDYFNYE